MPATRKILVISNARVLFDKLDYLLKKAGYEMYFVSSSDPGIQATIEKIRPKVLVIDPEFPGMNGLKLSLLVRRWTQAPILMISPADSGPDEIRILDVSSRDLLSEPLGVDLVAVRVEAL
jgi:DNA-binding response OmpR family regulator